MVEQEIPRGRGGRFPLVLNPEANTAVRNLTQEAGTFLGLAFTAYAPQLALVAVRVSTRGPALPWWLMLPALVFSDLLTAIFALATMARFDLAGGIARLYKPWPTAKQVLEQEGPTGGIAARWFNWEDAFFRRSEQREDDSVSRLLIWLSPYRQYPAIVGLALALLVTNYLVLNG